MTKLTTALLFLTFILGACSPGISSPEAIPTTVTRVPPTSTSETPKIILTVETPNIGQPPDGDFPSPTPTPTTSSLDCGYQWAYNDLPELTAQFDQAVKSLNPDSTSHATSFGENCLGSNGQVVKFLTMETDFYVTLTVSDLNDHEAFGNWIAQVMQVISNFPPDMIPGPKPGFVEFIFEKSEAERIIVRVQIQSYNETVNGKTGEELFNLFYTAP